MTVEKREAHQSPMLVVRSPPIIEADLQHGWQIVFWMGDAFDYATPFREALATIVEILGRCDPAALDLPPVTPDEDFVEGGLTWRNATLAVYYEYSLGYFSLMSHDREPLEDVAARVLPFVRVK